MSNIVISPLADTLPEDGTPANGVCPPRRKDAEDDCLGNNPLWPEFLAELASSKQADREQAEREYRETLSADRAGETSSVRASLTEGAADASLMDEDDRPEKHPLWQALLDEIAVKRQADLERDVYDYAE